MRPFGKSMPGFLAPVGQERACIWQSGTYAVTTNDTCFYDEKETIHT